MTINVYIYYYAQTKGGAETTTTTARPRQQKLSLAARNQAPLASSIYMLLREGD